MSPVRGCSRLALTATLLLASVVLAGSPTGPAAAAVADDDWRGIVNAYRAMSGLDPVGENPTWSDGGRAHSCYMLLNGISHSQDPAKPGYSEAGHAAGMNGNVAVSSAATATPRQHIDLWMTGPFHAIGILRHNLTTSGFGLCADAAMSPWRSGATLDVIRGLNSTLPRPTQPIVFPGREATVPLHRFVTEYPNPVTMCGWSGTAGLPLIAMMPAGVTNASATLSGPDGAPLEVCTLHPGNTGSNATAQGVLQSENAVVVVPRQELATGRYTATVTSNGGTVSWSFNVDPNAPLTSAGSPSAAQPAQPTATGGPLPTTTTIGGDAAFEPVAPYRHADSRQGLRVVRLAAGVVAQVEMASAEVDAVSANFTVVSPTAPGHLSVYDCTPSPPDVSTVNYTDRAAANQAVVPLAGGALCLVSSADADVIIDVNGWYRAPSPSTSSFQPLRPRRVYDTRAAGTTRLAPGEIRTVAIDQVPGATTAVALNLTAVEPAAAGWLRAFPCGGGGAGDVSNVNFAAGETRPNSAVVPLSADRTLCLQSDVHTDVIVDLGGAFRTSGESVFRALRPLRVLDTRSPSTALNPLTGGGHLPADTVVRLTLAGSYGIPGDARAVAVNVTAVGPLAPGFLIAFPCGEPPESSNLNFRPEDMAVANGAIVGLSDGGQLCLLADQPTHVLLDVSGIWR